MKNKVKIIKEIKAEIEAEKEEEFYQQQMDNSDVDNQLIEELIHINGNKNKALKYLLTLKPYTMNLIDFLFLSKEKGLKDILIKNKYTTLIGDRFFKGDIPNEFYSNHSKILNDYYDLSMQISIKQLDNERCSPPSKVYIITKRSVINKLMKEVGFINVLDKEIAPYMLRTLWYEEIKAENLKKDMVGMPNDIIGADIGMMKLQILHEIIFQEQGHKTYDTMEDLRREIKFDYDKFIDNQGELCMKCKYRPECEEEDDCRYYGELSKEEKDNFNSKPEYEPLSIEKLLFEIYMMFKEGILYLDTSIIES